MRKLTIPALVVTGALGVAGVAHAVDAQQGLQVKVGASKAGTKKKPRSIKSITVTTTTTPATPQTDAVTRQAVIYFDKNLVFNSGKFPSCNYVQALNLQAEPAAQCKKAQVGGGFADGRALGLPARLTVRAYNGPKGRNLWLRVDAVPPASPIPIHNVLRGALKTVSGAYGKKLVVDIPTDLQNIGGANVTLLKFQTTVNRTYKRIPYIALKGCTGGKLRFAGDFFFVDGDKKSVKTTTRCRR